MHGVSKSMYNLEKLDMYTYRIKCYSPMCINDRLGYYFRVTFDYNDKSIYPTFLITTK